jgi:predicted aspartyl protease
MSVQFAYSRLKVPPIPAVPIELVSPDGSRSVPGLVGFLDSAADRTVIPLPLAQQLGLRPTAQVRAQGFGTAVFTVEVYRFRLVIPGVIDLVVDALGHSTEPHVLVGRDALNQLRVTFDGPNNIVEFH